MAVVTSMQELPFNILTDLALPQKWLARLENARRDNNALDEVARMLETRRMTSPHDESLSIPEDAVTLEQAALFYYLVTTLKPILSIETGFKLGLAAAVITLAHMGNGLNGGHVPIQDQAKQVLDGAGFYTLQRLNLQGYQIMEHPPSVVLPQVYSQGLNQGLLFVYLNSAENADEQVMEYFYLNRMLNEGGVIAINTAHPARRRLVEFIREDRDDYAIRELTCDITLVQKPHLTNLARHFATRH